MFRADLHCHTTFSDGTLTPEMLIDKAIEIGLSALCITDHDSVEAYKTAIPHAKLKQILLGTGVEFSCAHKSVSVHLLGYAIDVTSPKLLSFCQRHTQRRTERNRQILEKLKQVKMPLDEKELCQMGHMIGRPHIALLMLKKGYVPSIKTAFQLYIGDNKPCYVRGMTFSIEETIDVIHEAGGKAFIAHPQLLHHSCKIKELLHFPIDGLECYYGRLDKIQEKRFIKLAKEKNLLISGGSDFHGETLEHAQLGSSWVDEETFHTIFTL